MNLNIKHDKSTDDFFNLEKQRMLNEINDLKEKIANYKAKYEMSFKEFEIMVQDADEETVNWEEYFDWKSLLNKRRILEREVRSIDNRGKMPVDEN